MNKARILNGFLIISVLFLCFALFFSMMQSRSSWNLKMAILNQDDSTAIKIIEKRFKLIDLNRFSDSRSRFEDTPLQLAILWNREKIAESLVEHGADVNLQNAYIDSPLIWAMMLDMKGLQRILLDHNGDVTRKGRQGITALHIAAISSPDLVGEIIQRGGDVNSKTFYGNTPLHFAVAEGNIDAVHKLIDAGADINATDSSGLTPLHLSIGKEQIMTLLIDSGANINAQGDFLHGNIKYVSAPGNWMYGVYLFSDLSDFKIRNKCKWTPLHYAAAIDNLSSVKTLIEAGADALIMDQMDLTPSDVARIDGEDEVFKYLEEIKKKTESIGTQH